MNRPHLSIVVPVFNEQDNIGPLLRDIGRVACAQHYSFEIIVVDDGSNDNTAPTLEALLKETPQLKVITLTYNSGKGHAYRAGFSQARGKVIVTMDGDLQDDPNDIPVLLARLAQGADCVVGWKQAQKGNVSKGFFSRLFNLVTALLTGSTFHDLNCPFRAMRAGVARRLPLRGNLYRFIPLLARARGFTVAEVPVSNLPRAHGHTKYARTKIFSGLFDLLTVYFLIFFIEKPLHFFGGAGALLFLAGFAIDAGLVINGLFLTGRIGHFALLLFGVLLMLLGIQLISIGLLGELVNSRTHKDDTGDLIHSIRCGRTDADTFQA